MKQLGCVWFKPRRADHFPPTMSSVATVSRRLEQTSSIRRNSAPGEGVLNWN